MREITPRPRDYAFFDGLNIGGGQTASVRLAKANLNLLLNRLLQNGNARPARSSVSLDFLKLSASMLIQSHFWDFDPAQAVEG